MALEFRQEASDLMSIGSVIGRHSAGMALVAMLLVANLGRVVAEQPMQLPEELPGDEQGLKVMKSSQAMRKG